jgi:hypothetical protein
MSTVLVGGLLVLYLRPLITAAPAGRPRMPGFLHGPGACGPVAALSSVECVWMGRE